MNDKLMQIIDGAMENKHGPVCLSHYDALCIKAALAQPDSQSAYKDWIGRNICIKHQNTKQTGSVPGRLIAVTEQYIVLDNFIVNHKDVCYIKFT